MSPVTLRMKMIRITIAPMANKPTRNSEIVVFFLAITTPLGAGSRGSGAGKSETLDWRFQITGPRPLAPDSKFSEEVANVRMITHRQLFVRAAEDDLAFF